ncbi:MAG: hypothetical protein KBD17_01855 [Candidatus Pacebacteria bacterium]|nr:hypothetical protein [Candidatus Paceibacterota bacterium]
MLPENIIYLCLVFTLFGSYHYIRDVINGSTRPNMVTWFFWALAPIIGTFFQIKSGAGWSVLPVFLAGFVPLIIFIVALFSGHPLWKITKFDIFCGLFALIALVLWIVTKRADIALIFAILSDLFAAIPTLIKSWKFPETETAVGYVPGILNNTLGLLIIKNWSFSIYSFGIYFIILNTTLILFIERKKLTSIFSRT